MKTFAKNLKQERISCGYTQKEMADMLGVPFRTYQNYELLTSNNREPDLEILCKISQILNVSIDYLLGLKII